MKTSAPGRSKISAKVPISQKLSVLLERKELLWLSPEEGLWQLGKVGDRGTESVLRTLHLILKTQRPSEECSPGM